MKKFLSKMLTVLVALATLAGVSIAAPAQFSENQNPISDINEMDIEELRDVHMRAISEGLCTANENTLEVDLDTKVLGISAETAQKYYSFISNLNDIAELGVIKINSDCSISSLSSEEVTKVIYERDQVQRVSNIHSDNVFDENHDTRNYSDQVMRIPATLNAYSIAYSNWKQLSNYYTTLAVSSPTSAWTNAVAWWVAKVKPNGAWDYKTVSGYKPYNKLWNAVQKNTTSVKTTEWFGNYNYGFTGKLLFSKSTLLNASQMVSYISSNVPDSDEDKAAVTQGYNEAP